MKSAIVTGAGAGIGEAISKKLSDNNYRVGMLDLNQDNVIEASRKKLTVFFDNRYEMYYLT